jgi:DNA repair exonuclease SbcCD ATPase subunit
MILFKKLRWKNFLSTGNIFTEIDLNKHNTTLIVGENGAGKSTMLDAITFSLFGKPFRSIKKPQLINSITQKGMVVEIEFDIGVNRYKIVRGSKPTVFEVYQNDELINQSAEMRDYQEQLERNILKLNFKSFCQVVVLGSASFVPFMQLPSGQRREVIEDLLDLQIFTTMNSLLKDKIARNNEELNDIANDQKVVTEKIKLVKEHLLEKQNNNEKIVAEKVNVIEDTKDKIDDLAKQLTDIMNEALELNRKTANRSEVENKVKKLTALRHQIEAKVALINHDVEFFKNHEHCPTCTQIIDENLKIEKINSKTSEIEQMNDGLEKLSQTYDQTQKELNEILQFIQIVADKTLEKVKIESQISSLNKYVKQLEREINHINQLQEADEDLKMADLEAELSVVADRYNEAMDDKLIYTAASMLLKDGGIKSRIIKQYVPVINKLIGKYLSAMDFFVQFELDEEFNETIKSRFRDEFSYSSFSEGEKMRINLAILFTWRAVAKLRNSVSTNLLIMDEVMDSSLDSNGTEEFLKILQSLTFDTNTFIISHKTDQLYDKFENVIRFEKKQNFSKVV